MDTDFRKNLRPVLIAIAVVAGAGLVGAGIGVVVAASNTTSHITSLRAKSYFSVDELIADSSVVVEGRVVAQEWSSFPADGGQRIPTTASTIEVTSVHAVTEGSPKGDFIPPLVGDRIQVVQDGTGDVVADVPLLSANTDYLLFLTASATDSPDAHVFFITGASAGLYVADGRGAFKLVMMGPDELPTTIYPAVLK